VCRALKLKNRDVGRLIKGILLVHLSGGCLFAASCGDQIRTAVFAGLLDFVGVATNQLVTQFFPAEDLLRDLLTSNPSQFPRT